MLVPMPLSALLLYSLSNSFVFKLYCTDVQFNHLLRICTGTKVLWTRALQLLEQEPDRKTGKIYSRALFSDVDAFEDRKAVT